MARALSTILLLVPAVVAADFSSCCQDGPADGLSAVPKAGAGCDSEGISLLQRRKAKLWQLANRSDEVAVVATADSADSDGLGAASVGVQGPDPKQIVPPILLFGFVIPLAMLYVSRRTTDSPGPAHEQPPGSPGALGGLARLKASVFTAAMCHFCMSYNAGVIAGAFLYINADPQLPTHSGWVSGAVTSSLLVGATAGALSSSLADVLGRRVTLLSVVGLYVVGAIVMAFAGTISTLLCGRFIAGLGVGLSSVIVNVYISEISPADCRGQLSGWAPLLGTFGILCSQVVSVVLGSLSPLGMWRGQLALVIAPACCVLFLQSLLVESPRWLLLRGLREQAAVSLGALFPEASAEAVDAELQMLGRDISRSKAAKQLSMLQVCCKKPLPVALGCGINVLQQVTGINVVIYFGPTVLEELNFSDHGALLAAIGVSGVQLCTVALSAALVDRIGRRRVAIVGMLAIMAGLALLVVAFAAKSVSPNEHWHAVAAVAGMLVFRAAFSFSLGPLPYIMTAELFSAEARAAGTALSWAANWGTNFLVCQSFPMVEQRLAALVGKDAGTSVIFSVYLAFCAAAFAVVLRVLPETSGLQLEKTMEEEGPSASSTSQRA